MQETTGIETGKTRICKIRVCGGGNDKFLAIIWQEIKNKTKMWPRCWKVTTLEYIYL